MELIYHTKTPCLFCQTVRKADMEIFWHTFHHTPVEERRAAVKLNFGGVDFLSLTDKNLNLNRIQNNVVNNRELMKHD